jgi:hypothetical protein
MPVYNKNSSRVLGPTASERIHKRRWVIGNSQWVPHQQPNAPAYFYFAPEIQWGGIFAPVTGGGGPFNGTTGSFLLTGGVTRTFVKPGETFPAPHNAITHPGPHDLCYEQYDTDIANFQAGAHTGQFMNASIPGLGLGQRLRAALIGVALASNLDNVDPGDMFINGYTAGTGAGTTSQVNQQFTGARSNGTTILPGDVVVVPSNNFVQTYGGAGSFTRMDIQLFTYSNYVENNPDGAGPIVNGTLASMYWSLVRVEPSNALTPNLFGYLPIAWGGSFMAEHTVAGLAGRAYTNASLLQLATWYPPEVIVLACDDNDSFDTANPAARANYKAIRQSVIDRYRGLFPGVKFEIWEQWPTFLAINMATYNWAADSASNGNRRIWEEKCKINDELADENPNDVCVNRLGRRLLDVEGVPGPASWVQDLLRDLVHASTAGSLGPRALAKHVVDGWLLGDGENLPSVRHRATRDRGVRGEISGRAF